MKQLAGKFKFTIPENHPEAGKEIEKGFDYQECETDDEAQTILTEKKLSLKDLVNDKLRSNARSNSYQNTLAMYRPSEVPPEQIAERAIRDLVRLGLSEEQARAMVESGVAATKQ